MFCSNQADDCTCDAVSISMAQVRFSLFFFMKKFWTCHRLHPFGHFAGQWQQEITAGKMPFVSFCRTFCTYLRTTWNCFTGLRSAVYNRHLASKDACYQGLGHVEPIPQDSIPSQGLLSLASIATKSFLEISLCCKVKFVKTIENIICCCIQPRICQRFVQVLSQWLDSIQLVCCLELLTKLTVGSTFDEKKNTYLGISHSTSDRDEILGLQLTGTRLEQISAVLCPNCAPTAPQRYLHAVSLRTRWRFRKWICISCTAGGSFVRGTFAIDTNCESVLETTTSTLQWSCT